MKTIRALAKTGEDGALVLKIPLGEPEMEFDVLVVVQPQESATTTLTPEQRGWPSDYFALAGSITDETFIGHPQGELPKPIDLA